jgi:preprotein translocase subunit SecE
MLKSPVIKFINEAVAELKQVVWPSKKQIVKLTVVVIGVSLITGLFIGGLDYLFTQLIGKIVK